MMIIIKIKYTNWSKNNDSGLNLISKLNKRTKLIEVRFTKKYRCVNTNMKKNE